MVVFARHQQFAAAQEAIKEGIVKEVWISYILINYFVCPRKMYILLNIGLHSVEPKKISLTGICEPKCLNGGKCIQKDKCQCTKGFYGPQCEFCEYKK